MATFCGVGPALIGKGDKKGDGEKGESGGGTAPGADTPLVKIIELYYIYHKRHHTQREEEGGGEKERERERKKQARGTMSHIGQAVEKKLGSVTILFVLLNTGYRHWC